MTKHSNNGVLQRGIAKLRMADQTVMEANSLGVMVKATQIDQDIYRIYKYNPYEYYANLQREVLAISNDEFSFVKVLPKPEQINLSKLSDSNIVVL